MISHCGNIVNTELHISGMYITKEISEVYYKMEEAV